MVQFFFDSIVGKGENCGYQHFLLFQQCFQKVSFPRSLCCNGYASLGDLQYMFIFVEATFDFSYEFKCWIENGFSYQHDTF